MDHLPDMMIETDFLARAFPSPDNPHRPLAIVRPRAGEETADVADVIEELACRGYGGLLLDHAAFDSEPLGRAWFELVGIYIEACRLAGLFLWLTDGFTAGSSLSPLLDRSVPSWRGRTIAGRRMTIEGPERLDFDLGGLLSGHLLGLLARRPDESEPPINLLTRVSEGRLIWDPPPGKWTVEVFCLDGTAGRPDKAFAWNDEKTAAAWLEVAYEPYQELFGVHLGRTLQGFFALCPTLPGADGNSGEIAWPAWAANGMTWLELSSLWSPGADDVQPALDALAGRIRRTYLRPLHDWCWRRRLRLAGYRLGGSPLPAAMGHFDLGGLPDLLNTEPAENADELAILAGVARHFGQDKIDARLALSGEPAADRRILGGLASAGANSFLFQPKKGLPQDCEAALTDYAARMAMTVAAGRPAAGAELAIGQRPDNLKRMSAKAADLARRGIAIGFRPSGCEDAGGRERPAAADADPANSTAAELAAMAENETSLPPELSLCDRRVEKWRVFTFFNRGRSPWRGPVDLPVSGNSEIWEPATGEQRPAAAIRSNPVRLPLAFEPGEALTVVVGRPGFPEPSLRGSLVTSSLSFDRSWSFEARGGNIQPLSWMRGSGNDWSASLYVLSVPDDIRLVGRPYPSLTWINGRLLPAGEHEARLGEYLVTGENRLVMRTAEGTPRAHCRGDFACRGAAVERGTIKITGPWTQNGYPHFAGPGIYSQRIDIPRELVSENLLARLEISAMLGAALVTIDGQAAGSLPWPPYRLELGRATELLHPGGNLFEIEVHVPDNKPAWDMKGLAGEVTLIFREVQPGDSSFANGDANH